MTVDTQDDLHLRTLRVFVTLAECGVMSVAGARLGVTQARVSQTIRALEDRFGAELFARDRRPLELTRSGKILYEKALQILELGADIGVAMRSVNAVKRPFLHLAGANSFVDVVGGLLLPRIAGYADRWRMTGGLTPDHVDLLLSREADMIVTVDEMLEQYAGLARYELMREPYVLAVPAGLEGAADISELARTYPLIRSGLSGGTGRQTVRHLMRMHVEPIQTVEIESSFAQLTLIARHQGWAVTTPLCFASAPGFRDSVRLEPITRGSFRRQLSLIGRQGADDEVAGHIAEASRDILRTEVFATLIDDYPWLADAFTFF